ncbi:cytochrome B6 [Prochlorococcus sp. MIT 1223]|uniref:cytochrome B6 n=1 Tax=Prochlorococcus sp. MIT 1223 TaxID=3096217 RepID=UPI002A75133E|nr:cytochrome B6 [Prochlorococcus sp. MIT 1223]
MNFFLCLFAFISNADAADGFVFGKHIETWLIYTLVVLGLTLFGYMAVWGLGILRDLKSGQSIKQPWD